MQTARAILISCILITPVGGYAAPKELFSKQEIICLKGEEARPWDLKWALTEDSWNTSTNAELFVTVHERANADAHANAILPGYDPEYTAAIYIRVGDKFRLLKRLDSFMSYFLKPNIVWASTKGDRELLVQVTEIAYGTGHLATEHVFTPTYDLTLEEVEFIPAHESYKTHLARGEGWQFEANTFTDNGLFFRFFIGKEGDGNCCPSAGKVTGTYKLERSRRDGGLRISMDTFKREPVSNSD
jgi:hypothetical protein